jgi:S-adenosylmethionine:tRNA ribosyltransferase-isomerase
MTKITDYDYHLPPELIAQHPVDPRDTARLLVLDRKTHTLGHDTFFHLDGYLQAGDLLIVNNTKVIAARLFGKLAGGGKGEVFLLRPLDGDLLTWEALVRPGRKLQPTSKLVLGDNEIEILERTAFGGRLVRFRFFDWEMLDKTGEIPLPPYIKSPLRQESDYQTIFAQQRGAVAAPTAGLHFTPEGIERIKAKGVSLAEITLHAGLGTFRPIRAEEIEDHQMHEEAYFIPPDTAEAIREVKGRGGRVFACGTTVVRALESAARGSGAVCPTGGMTDLFIRPGFSWQVCDAIITNFHLPKSTLLLLVSAFASHDFILQAYRVAVEERYRFFSFGDAMLIL